MQENKDLITLPGETLPSDEVFDLATQSGKYLPRFQLMTSASEVCKSGEFPINHFALVKDQNMQDLGDEVDSLIISWRPKAMEFGEETISCYDPKDPVFKEIQAKSETLGLGYMFGPEFLIYIPSYNDGSFATFFMASKTMRRDAALVRTFVKKAGTFVPKKITGRKHTWYTVAIKPCTTIFDLPEEAKLHEVYENFMNPPAQEVEKAPEQEEKRAR